MISWFPGCKNPTPSLRIRIASPPPFLQRREAQLVQQDVQTQQEPKGQDLPEASVRFGREPNRAGSVV